MADDTTLAFNNAGNFSILNLPTPGITPNFTSLQPSVSAVLSQNTNLAAYAPTQTGATALKNKNQGSYSNKQFVTPWSYAQNVEGTFIQVDYLGKRINADGSMPYRSIASLSAISPTYKVINSPTIGAPDRTVKVLTTAATLVASTTAANAAPSTTPTQNAFIQQYGVGTNAFTGVLGGRLTQYTSLLQTPTSQLFSNLASTGTAVLQGELQNKLPFSTINQQIANLPGFSIVTNALGNIPGGSSVVSALTNPVGTATNVLQQTLANSIQLQGDLPSLSLGSLGDLFSLASNVASSGPPTSLTGLITLEKQVKGIVCNFTLPILNPPTLKAITNFKFPKPEDISRWLKKEYEDIKSNITNQFNIVKQLAKLLPNPEDIYKQVVKELTVCDKSPTSQKNAKNGKKSAPAPSGTPQQ
jgi:hypothetical protein